ncbi:MAG TPA: hypothetical protein VHX68_11510 [Planctomycetaceae bacterium]|jgi:hypothetical protein|nr:hypothetical protein [Planctomycetaceae bacterium]
MAYLIPRDRDRSARLRDEPPALRRRSSAAHGTPFEDRDSTELAEVRRKAGGSFHIIARRARIIADRHFIGFAIVSSLVSLCHAATPAAQSTAPSSGVQKTAAGKPADRTGSPPLRLAIHGTVVDEN